MISNVATAIMAMTLVTGTNDIVVPRVELENIIHEMVSNYDIDQPDITYHRRIPGYGFETFAVTRCHLGECTIQLRTCVERLEYGIAEHVVAHEAAHYINAMVNQVYDHGDEWGDILIENNWPVIENYDERLTTRC